MPKNAQTTTQLHSSHMLVKYSSKFSKPGFSNTWTVNFLMFKLVLKKNRGTRDQIANICWIMEKAREFQKNIYFCFIDCAKAFVWITINLRNLYLAYKLNKQGDDIQPWRTLFLIWNQSAFPCPVLTVASWPAYRFFRRQVRWSGIPILWRIFQFIVILTVKGFEIINKAVDVFLELLLFWWSNRWFLCLF